MTTSTNDSRYCECERWRNGITVCPMHGTMKPLPCPAEWGDTSVGWYSCDKDEGHGGDHVTTIEWEQDLTPKVYVTPIDPGYLTYLEHRYRSY